MNDWLKKYLTHHKKVAGVEINLQEQLHQLQIVILEKQKQSIGIVGQQSSILGLDLLSGFISLNTPLAISLTGKGIIHKPLTRLPETAERAITAVLPNARADDFIYQTQQLGDTYWISIVRRTTAEAIIQKLQALGFYILHLSIGILSLPFVLPFIPKQYLSWQTAGFEFQTSNGKIIQFQKTTTVFSTDINIDNEQLNSSLILAFSTAFPTLLQATQLPNNASIIEESKRDFFYKKLFQFLGWIFLIGTFSVLCVNFALFSWFSQQNQQLNTILLYHRQQLHQLDSLQHQYQTKQIFFEQSSALKPSKTSYYLDQIGQSIPKGIRLTNLQLFPPLGKNKRERDKAIRFHLAIIYIKGICQKSIVLNNWIRSLEKLDWVQEVKVLPYAEQVDGTGTFELELLLK